MSARINRRELIALAGSALPIAARGQQPAMPVIGFLSSTGPESPASLISGFREGLSKTGFVEGRNVAFEYRSADGQYDRLPPLAADLVRRGVAVIVALGSGPAALAAKAATRTIPIVFDVGFDPVQNGLVATLNHPGGNLTGVVRLNSEVAAKRVGLLHEMLPAATSIALLVNPSAGFNAEVQTKALEGGIAALGLRSLVLNASDQSGIERAFATLVQERAHALVVAE